MNSFIENVNQFGGRFLDFAWPMLWQSSLLIVILFALDFLFQRKIRASIRYACWFVVVAKLLLPPTLALPTGAAWWLQKWERKPPAPIVKNYTVTYGTFEPPNEIIPQTVPLPAIQPKISFAAWLFLASAVVGAILFFWLMVRWWQISRKVWLAEPGKNLDEILQSAKILIGSRSRARLKIVDDPMSPAVCGLFRPVILLPRTLAEKLSAEQLRAVLLHELIHLRRADVWLNCAQALLQIVYWWHPLVWLANARIRRVREEAVDDAVMLALRDAADHYAPTLLEVAKLAFRRPLMSLGLVGIMESRSALRQRIERLLDFRAPRKAGLTVVSVLGIFIFSAVAVPMGEAPNSDVEQTLSSPVVGIVSAKQTVIEQNTNPPEVLIQAEIYRMRQADFEKLNSDLKNDQSKKGSVEKFQKITAALKATGLEPIQRPRVQTSSGMPAEFYVGDETNSIEFDCLPRVTNGLINLETHFEIVLTTRMGTQQTNQMVADDTLQNGGGKSFGFVKANAAGESNITYVIIGAEIITNTARFGQRLNRVVKRADNTNESVTQVANLVQDGKLFYEMGRLDEAQEKIGEALVINPSNRAALYYHELIGMAESGRTNSSDGTKNFVLPVDVRHDTIAKLSHIRLAEISFQNLPLNKVALQLTEESMSHDPDKSGVHFELAIPAVDSADQSKSNKADFASIFVTFSSATNISLQDALDAIVSYASQPVYYSILANGSVIFVPKESDEPTLFMRTFKLDPKVFNSNLQHQLGTNLTDVQNVSQTARFFFTKLGVDLESPKGKNVFYNDRNGLLFVKATEADLDTIERAIQALNQVEPQIRIQARFLRAPKGTLSNLGNFLDWTNSSAKNFTGILDTTNAGLALKFLESKKDVEELAEPEAVTLSGRQMQMRATQIITVVTNFIFQTNGDSAIAPQTEQVETGPILDVVPYVLADGYTVNLTVIPSMTEFLGYDQPPPVRNVTGTNNLVQLPVVLPQFSVRQTVAHLNLWDGQTMVIGGMVQANRVTDKVPVLGDIPLVGNLFKNEKTTENEILVFITTDIVDPAGNRIHNNNEMPFAQNRIPPQPSQK